MITWSNCPDNIRDNIFFLDAFWRLPLMGLDPIWRTLNKYFNDQLVIRLIYGCNKTMHVIPRVTNLCYILTNQLHFICVFVHKNEMTQI